MRYLFLGIFFLFCSCSTTHLPMGCLVNSTSYKYSILAKNQLSGRARILIVEYKNTNVSHAYCIFSTNGKDLYAYDSHFGSVNISSLNSAREIAESLTQVFTNKQVKNAYFLED